MESEPVVRFGQCKCRDRISAGDFGQPFGLLPGASEQADRAGSQALHGEGEIGQAGAAGKQGADHGEAAHIGNAIAIGHAQLQQPGLAERGDQRPAGCIDIGAMRRIAMIAAPVADSRIKFAMAVLQERPVQPVSHP